MEWKVEERKRFFGRNVKEIVSQGLVQVIWGVRRKKEGLKKEQSEKSLDFGTESKTSIDYTDTR